MRRDWIWGWVAALPSLIVAFLTIQSTSLYSESRSIAAGTALALATVTATGVLWIRNRHSLRKMTRSGGDIELVIRPVEALSSATMVFVAMLNVVILAYLVIEGPAVAGWRLALASAATISTGVLCIMERQSLRSVNQSRSDIERYIASIDGLWLAAISFIAITGTITLWKLAVERQVALEWGLGIIIIALVSYIWSLRDTAYKKPA